MLEGYLIRATRTRWPLRKFKPSVWHNDDGNMWHVYLTGEQHFVSRRTLNLDVYVGEESGDVVGFDVWDENLRNPWKKGASDEQRRDWNILLLSQKTALCAVCGSRRVYLM